ncbi:MAG: L-2-amino-thiazoline-4-carboxylic acid hydrolase [Alphaproteobacteria bacterium]|jgi:hypothetical protein|nr:hypothetical protein [Rhodospirillaceae bacterium]MDP6407388.1 L-2-amino-thiazoline-4-carboxylic acid hydrolase [Alphaproteobacteria bacterium]MDP6622365.1 L-2-amino-thiazoline-4-carboxylic acid hydrolase [Alphaproteobacteria bacterium]|tara:strand:+ start:1295 stop:1780 length:486 start_codon:yes stop_codon:yes gene_type:complete
MTEEELATQHIWVPKVRAAVKDRAAWLLYLYRAFSDVLPPEEVEKRLRQGVREFGHLKGRRDGAGFTSRQWIDGHENKGSKLVFDSKLVRGNGTNEQQMGFCPLVELWRDEGCTPEETLLLCDIAMEGDRGRAEAHGMDMELEQTLAAGDACCRLIIHDNK